MGNLFAHAMKTPIYGGNSGRPNDVFRTLKASYFIEELTGTIRNNGLVDQALHYSNAHKAIEAPTGLNMILSSEEVQETVGFSDGHFRVYDRVKLYVALYAGADDSTLTGELNRLGYSIITVSNITGADYATAAGGTGDYTGASAYKLYNFRAGAGRRTTAPGTSAFKVPELNVPGGDLGDAPVDGMAYVRKDGAWQHADHSTANLDDAAGYFFQNSHFFSGGLSHDSNPDVIDELEADTDAIVKFSDATPGESGQYLQTNHQDHDHGGDSSLDHFYDRSTGVITLHHALPAEFVLVRLAIDINPDSDNSSANIILRCTANGASGGFSFDIEEQLVSLDQGAEIDYPAVASIPIFIGDTLSESPMGSPATIQPIIRLKNTSADIKPRSLAFFIWS